MAREFLAHQVFERIQLEQAADDRIRQVGITPVGGHADVLDRDDAAFDTGLDRAIAQIGDRALVLG